MASVTSARAALARVAQDKGVMPVLPQEHFDGDFPSQVRVTSLEDGAHATPGDLLENL
jgi:hypothetical protein